MTRLGAVLSLIVAALACGGSKSPTTPGTPSPGDGLAAGVLSFTTLPVDPSVVMWITPLGNLNPPAHTLPTDHIYFYIRNPQTLPRPAFRAPADGTVTLVLGGVGQESKVFVKTTSTFQYYLDHLLLTAPIAAGSLIKAGDVLGTTGLALAVDLGVINASLTLPFVAPTRYLGDTLHADAPLKYFVEPLKSQLYAMVQRLGPDLDGTIVYDVAGRLSGNWFGPDSTPMSFAYDTYDPSRVLLSLQSGTVLGVFTIGAGEPAPRDVSVSTGTVRYSLYQTANGVHTPDSTQAGWMLVRLTDATHIQWETFTTATTPVDFTSPRSSAR